MIMSIYRKTHLYLTIFQTSLLMSIKTKSILLIVIVLSLLSVQSIGKEISELDINHNLLKSCNAFKTNKDTALTQPCIYYIRGFLNSRFNVDNSNLFKLSKESQKPSTLTERAYASRVGKANMHASQTQSSYYCSSVSEVEARIVERLSNDLLNSINSIKNLNNHFYDIMKTVCSAENISD